MKENVNLTGELLGHVDKHVISCVQILNVSNVLHEKFKWLNTYVNLAN